MPPGWGRKVAILTTHAEFEPANVSSGREANKIIYDVVINGKDIDTHRAFSAIPLFMGAFPPGSIPDIRRAERFARCLRISLEDAEEDLAFMDAYIDRGVFPPIPSHDASLIKLYQGDGNIESTGVLESVPVPVVVPHQRCVLCDASLNPATETSPPGNPVLLTESGKATRVHTTHGSFLAKSYPR